MGIFKKTKQFAVDGPGQDRKPVKNLPAQLLWLADVPLFIDERRVEAFYDAVFRPDYGETTRTLQTTVGSETTLGGTFKLGALLPGLFAKADASLSGEHKRERGRADEVVLRPVSNAYRHLLALALHYSSDKPERLVLAGTPGVATDGTGQSLPSAWLDSNSDFISEPPRAMIMLELAAGCKLIPAAVELDDGTVEPLFETLARDFAKPGSATALAYPGSHAPTSKRNEYWQWFVDNYDDRRALDAVEDATAGKKVQWIAFRVGFGDEAGSFLHLSLSARGAYDTGVFGYNFINRGAKHGVRIIGTVKTEPDIDVLAVFER